MREIELPQNLQNLSDARRDQVIHLKCAYAAWSLTEMY